MPSIAASKASLELETIQGKRGIWFCGAYQGMQSWQFKLEMQVICELNVDICFVGYGFHEDGLKVMYKFISKNQIYFQETHAWTKQVKIK